MLVSNSGLSVAEAIQVITLIVGPSGIIGIILAVVGFYRAKKKMSDNNEKTIDRLLDIIEAQLEDPKHKKTLQKHATSLKKLTKKSKSL